MCSPQAVAHALPLYLSDLRPREVEVFHDGANVRRTSSVAQLPAGTYRVILDGLPELVSSDAIAATVNKPNVVCEPAVYHFEQAPLAGEESKDIERQIERLQRHRDHVADEVKVLDKRDRYIKALVARFESAPTYLTHVDSDAALHSRSLRDSYTFIFDEQAHIRTERLQLANQTRIIHDAIATLHSALEKLQGINVARTHASSVIAVSREGLLTYTLEYSVKRVTWQPLYVGRIDTQSQQLKFTYNALIEQSTGEDWQNVRLSARDDLRFPVGEQAESKPIVIPAANISTPHEASATPQANAATRADASTNAAAEVDAVGSALIVHPQPPVSTNGHGCPMLRQPHVTAVTSNGQSQRAQLGELSAALESDGLGTLHIRVNNPCEAWLPEGKLEIFVGSTTFRGRFPRVEGGGQTTLVLNTSP